MIFQLVQRGCQSGVHRLPASADQPPFPNSDQALNFEPLQQQLGPAFIAEKAGNAGLLELPEPMRMMSERQTGRAQRAR